MSEAAQVARALKARPSGDGWVARCPCPGHGSGRGDKNASLSIKESPTGALLLNCFSGCGFTEILDELRVRGAVETDGPKLNRVRQALKYIEAKPADIEPNQAALRLWKGAVPILGTPVQTYLERRGIVQSSPSLRCCYHLDDQVGFVAAVQRADDQIIAAQVKLITQDGLKVEGSHPDTVGNLGDGAVRLGPATRIMGIAEGVETALSAMAMADMPVWASIGSKRLHRVELPEIVQEVHIFCDNDKPGHEAAQRAADIHVKARRRVVMRFPPADLNDYNDFLLALADRSAAA